MGARLDINQNSFLGTILHAMTFLRLLVIMTIDNNILYKLCN